MACEASTPRENFDLVWLSDRAATPQMTALRAAMDAAASYGLDPAGYPTPHLAAMYVDDPASLAEADVEFSLAAARFVMHLGAGRIRPRDISSIITLEPEYPDIAPRAQFNVRGARHRAGAGAG